MRKLFWVLVLLFSFVPLGKGQAHAESVSVVSQEIHIRAVVPDMRTIIVNDQNQIVEVDSNTTKNVVPKVYRGGIRDANEIALSPAIEKDYEAKLQSANTQQAGILYQAGPASAQPGSGAGTFVSDVLAALRNLSYIF